MTRNHISICICSFKRPHLLKCTLENLRELATEGLFSYSIVVADNDREESARATVGEFARTSLVEVVYCTETEQNISLARNKALEFAKGDLIAWIDDDEFPDQDWLLVFFKALQKFKTDGVLGPVKPIFESPPPSWIIKGRFFEKPRRRTGLRLHWHQTSTANALVHRRILDGVSEPFRREFGSGCEDIDFFKRMIQAGYTFVWCDEAIVSEIVPPTRWKQGYLFRRALLRGQNGCSFADFRSVLKSIIAVPLYLMLLPFLLVAGRHLFVRYVMKVLDHAGKILGVLGLRLMGSKYLAG
ncbi:MAG TPA: glycosyltransferase family 2 protein [Candidatus Aquilonibacter sp.]|nr:glycosyltransferase family 2 protein [Candidatus Aquilonibacter sp.]